MIDEDRAPTLDELANMLFVSRPHVCSAFSHETGQSIGHYARARRMERAKTMLVGCCSVAQVATRLGWTRCSTFSQAFKQSTGVSPIEWRNSNSQ
ncbi:helix-turn-helix domain-containing protein [Slackia isoflavoniconvertens]|uniref:helix-turn-helix domain-containing protein n=1 Tax=Slackia isoflavoniconvertens TaxID=572010 RepID=UPI0039AF1033